MKKCTHCGYKNKDTEDACNLCHGKLPKDPTPEGKEAFHEPRSWTGSASGAPPARIGGIERGKRDFGLGTGGEGPAAAPAPAAPAAPAAPRVDLATERHYLVPPQGEVVRLEVHKTAAIGRDAACEVKVASGKVSRRHCEVRWEGSPTRPVVYDLGSQNGTYVNEKKLDSRGKYPIADGEEIEIGDVRYRYRCLAPGVAETDLRETSAATIVSEGESDAGLTGNAALLPIGEVLRRLGALGAWGTLEVEVGSNKGVLELKGGKPVTGNYAGLEGSAAMTAVAALKTGRFRFEQIDPPAADAPAPERGPKAPPAPPRDSSAAGPKGPPAAPRAPAPAPKQNPPPKG